MKIHTTTQPKVTQEKVGVALALKTHEYNRLKMFFKEALISYGYMDGTDYDNMCTIRNDFNAMFKAYDDLGED